MSDIIFLNGCGSAGKTSIAQSLQHLSQKPWLHFSMDMFIDMMPKDYIARGEKAKEGYFSFVGGRNDRGPTLRVETGPLGPHVFGALPSLAKTLADFGNNLIIDEVLLAEETLKSYGDALKDHRVYFIGIFCDFKSLQEREILRGDRALGLSNDQLDRVHGDFQYDFKVNTAHLSPLNAAKEILAFQEMTPDPIAFKNLGKFF